jgi:DEAD/DEAH box helicase domain-containing protein
VEKPFFDSLTSAADYDGQLVAKAVDPAKPARYGVPAVPFPAPLQAALDKRGIARLYSHQAQAVDLARAGKHVTVVTPTASGKTLSCALPVMEACKGAGKGTAGTP